MEDNELITKTKNYEKYESDKYLDVFQKSGELSDEELSYVGGGGFTKFRKGKTYCGYPPYYLITTPFSVCNSYRRIENNKEYVKNGCASCLNAKGNSPMYCKIRTYYDDIYNPSKSKK